MSGMIQYLRELHFASVVVRLALAMLLGGCIGLERGRKRRPAGFRTYMLVCLGAALTVLLSLYEFTMVTGPWSDICAEIGIKTDVSRFGAQVINGIGFLGAGTILVTGRQQVKGLTTAAGLGERRPAPALRSAQDFIRVRAHRIRDDICSASACSQLWMRTYRKTRTSICTWSSIRSGTSAPSSIS